MVRDFTDADIPALQTAIDADRFHPGEWKVWHFQIKAPGFQTKVVEDSKGPTAFVIYSPDETNMRVSCVWTDGADVKRNGKAIFYGLRDAISVAREQGFTGIVIETVYPKLAEFLVRVFKMTQQGNDYLLTV